MRKSRKIFVGVVFVVFVACLRANEANISTALSNGLTK